MAARDSSAQDTANSDRNVDNDTFIRTTQDSAGQRVPDDAQSVSSRISNISKRSSVSERAMERRAKLAAVQASMQYVEKELSIEQNRVEAERQAAQNRVEAERQAALNRAEAERQVALNRAEAERIMSLNRAESERLVRQLNLEKEAAIVLAELNVYKQFEDEEENRVRLDQIPMAVQYVQETMSPRNPSYMPMGSSEGLHAAIYNTQSNSIVQGMPVFNADIRPTHTVSQMYKPVSESHHFSPVRTNEQRVVDSHHAASSSATRYHMTNVLRLSHEEPRHRIDSSQAPAEIYVQPESKSSANLYQTSDISGQAVRTDQYIADKNMHRSNRSTCSNDSSNCERAIISLTETFKQSQLPKIELSVFSGEPIEFQRWLVSFEKLIEESTTDPARRIHYLLQYTTGSANLLVAGHALNPTDMSYQAAKEELMKEFGNSYLIARAYLNKIESWKNIAANDTTGLKSFSIFLKSCRGSMSTLKHLQQLNTDLYLQKIVAKLAVNLQASWREHVSQLELNSQEITFYELVNFIDRKAQVSTHPVFSAEALSRVNSNSVAPESNTFRSTKVVAATSASISRSSIENSERCPKCNDPHDLDDCISYLDLSVEDRKRFVLTSRLCFSCYAPTSVNHLARNCCNRRKCQSCGRSHPTGLHDPQKIKHNNNETSHPDQSAETIPKMIACATKSYDGSVQSVAMSIVPVLLRYGESEVKVYAALDTMSSACFMSRELWQLIGCPGKATEITVKTVTEESTMSSTVVTGLTASAVNGNEIISLPEVFVQDTLPISTGYIASHDVINKHSHLRHLTSKIPDRDDKIPVALLIGANCPKALEPVQCVHAKGNSLCAIETSLGWSVFGPVESSIENSLLCNPIRCEHVSVDVKESQLTNIIQEMYRADFTESKRNPSEIPEAKVSNDTPAMIIAASAAAAVNIYAAAANATAASDPVHTIADIDTVSAVRDSVIAVTAENNQFCHYSSKLKKQKQFNRQSTEIQQRKQFNRQSTELQLMTHFMWFLVICSLCSLSVFRVRESETLQQYNSDSQPIAEIWRTLLTLVVPYESRNSLHEQESLVGRIRCVNSINIGLSDSVSVSKIRKVKPVRVLSVDSIRHLADEPVNSVRSVEVPESKPDFKKQAIMHSAIVSDGGGVGDEWCKSMLLWDRLKKHLASFIRVIIDQLRDTVKGNPLQDLRRQTVQHVQQQRSTCHKLDKNNHSDQSIYQHAVNIVVTQAKKCAESITY